MEHLLKPVSIRDELRTHSRYIRDTLVPILSHENKLGHSDTILIHSIFKKLKSTPMNLDLLRYSRMEKALMVIAATGASCWPMEVVVMAKEMMQKWEDQLGPLKNLKADLYGPDGKLEGLRKITIWKHGEEERDDDAKSAWSVEGGVDPTRAHRYGHLGFQVGHWWLKPAAAFRDGIIDETSHAITANQHGVYAIVLTRAQSQDLNTEGYVKFHAAQNDPGASKLLRTIVSDTDKVVRVLRSWKLSSKLAPKAGLRYDGLYQIISCGVKLNPPNSWHVTATLARIPDQPPIQQALAVPMADQLDDWKDYQHLKTIDRGEDFAFLREVASSPITGLSEEMGMKDSRSISRRGSKKTEKGEETPELDEEGEGEYFSRRTSSKFGGKQEDVSAEVAEEDDGEESSKLATALKEAEDGFFSRQFSNLRLDGHVPATPALEVAATPAFTHATDDASFFHQGSTASKQKPFSDLTADSDLKLGAERTPCSTHTEPTPTVPSAGDISSFSSV